MLTSTKWLRRESRYARNAYDGGPELVVDVFRSSPLLLVAPHAVNHHDERGQAKVADLLTGGLAETLAEHLGASVLVASHRVPPWSTWEQRTDRFTQALHDHLAFSRMRLVVDLHGMLDSHGIDLCIGLGDRPGELERAVADELLAAFADHAVSIDRPFSARGHWTVVARAQALGISAIQVEIARRLREPDRSPAIADNLLQRMAHALRGYS